MQSWQVYQYARKVLPKGFLERIYSRSPRLIYMWGSSPTHTDSNERNPIDRLSTMLSELDRLGYQDVARAAVDLIAEPIGGRFEPFPEVESDKGTVDGEAADTTIALGHLIETARKSMKDVRMDRNEAQQLLAAFRSVQQQLNELMDVVMRSDSRRKSKL